MTKDGIKYAIRSNALEGLKTSPETVIILEKVSAGEITTEQMRKAIDYKARSLAKGEYITLIQAWELISR